MKLVLYLWVGTLGGMVGSNRTQQEGTALMVLFQKEKPWSERVYRILPDLQVTRRSGMENVYNWVLLGMLFFNREQEVTSFLSSICGLLNRHGNNFIHQIKKRGCLLNIATALA